MLAFSGDILSGVAMWGRIGAAMLMISWLGLLACGILSPLIATSIMRTRKEKA